MVIAGVTRGDRPEDPRGDVQSPAVIAGDLPRSMMVVGDRDSEADRRVGGQAGR